MGSDAERGFIEMTGAVRLNDVTDAPVGGDGFERDPGERQATSDSTRDRSPSEGTWASGSRDRSITIGGDLTGIASTGDFAFNVVIPASGQPELRSVMRLDAHAVPLLPETGDREPVGREDVLDLMVADLAAGRSVQLYGAPGVGKKAVMRAALGRLAASGKQGHVLLPQGGEPDNLEGLYRRLAGAMFGEVFLRVDEAMLRAAATDVRAIIAIADCELAAADITRLLESFPRCRFLITSQFQTMYRIGGAYKIQPLSQQAALTLIAQELGSDPIGLQNVQFEQAYRLAEGRTQRLLQYAAFLKTSQNAPGGAGYADPLEVTPHAQAVLLASRLSEPARRVLVALAAFDVGLSPEYFRAVTGLAQIGEAAAELRAARMATCEDDVYRITEDAGSAVRALQWQPIDPAAISQALVDLLTDHTPETQAPELMLAVARALDRSGQPDRALDLLKAATPLALRTGHVNTWIALVALGIKAARAAGRPQDVGYFLTEDRARDLLRGDRAAALAALAVLAELLEQHRHRPNQTPRRRKLSRRARKALPASPAVAALTLTAIIAVIAAVSVIAAMALNNSASSRTAASAATKTPEGRPARSSDAPVLAATPSLRQFTGLELAAALLPLSDFPAGSVDVPLTVPAVDPANSGGSLITGPPRVDLASAQCGSGSYLLYAGQVAFAQATENDSPNAGSGQAATQGPLYGQEIMEFRSADDASMYVSRLGKYIARCSSFSATTPVAAGTFSTLQRASITNVDADPALITDIQRSWSVSSASDSEDRSLFVAHRNFVFEFDINSGSGSNKAGQKAWSSVDPVSQVKALMVNVASLK